MDVPLRMPLPFNILEFDLVVGIRTRNRTDKITQELIGSIEENARSVATTSTIAHVDEFGITCPESYPQIIAMTFGATDKTGFSIRY